MLEENTIDQLGALVLDEMHMIGDPHRGYIMELLVTKVLAIQLPIQVGAAPSALCLTTAYWNVCHYEECRSASEMDSRTLLQLRIPARSTLRISCYGCKDPLVQAHERMQFRLPLGTRSASLQLYRIQKWESL